MCQAWHEALVQGQKTRGLDQMPKVGETWRLWLSWVSGEDDAEEEEPQPWGAVDVVLIILGLSRDQLKVTILEFSTLIFQARLLKWSEVKVALSDSLWPHGLYSPCNSPGQNTGVIAFLFSRGSSQPRDQSQVSCIAGGFFTSWATREAQEYWSGCPIPSPADLPEPGTKLGSPALQADSVPTELSGNPQDSWATGISLNEAGPPSRFIFLKRCTWERQGLSLRARGRETLRASAPKEVLRRVQF